MRREPRVMQTSLDGCYVPVRDPVWYGLHKGKVPQDQKKPHNLMTLYRPIVAESLVTGPEAHAAKIKQVHTLEASGLYPPDYYAYRSELRVAKLALASRAVCTSSLEVYWAVAHCGWDESHAYPRKQRDLISPMNQQLSPMWDYGPWAEGF